MNGKKGFRVGEVVATMTSLPGIPINRFGQLIRYESIKGTRHNGMWEVAFPFRKVVMRWIWENELRELSRKELGTTKGKQ